MKLSIGGKKSERGNSMVEFAIVMPFWIALLFGMLAVGTNLTRTIQVIQTSRDLGNMYAQGTDFSASGFQNLITGGGSPPSASLVQGMNLNSASGNAVIIFSKVRHVYAADIDCANTCANKNTDVFINRIIIGNSAMFTSALGNPKAADLNSAGNTLNPLTEPLDKTNGLLLFKAPYTIPSGKLAFVVEVYQASPDVSFLNFNLGSGLNLQFGNAGNYSRQVF
jgi:Flp pilus assembly protein TadG